MEQLNEKAASFVVRHQFDNEHKDQQHDSGCVDDGVIPSPQADVTILMAPEAPLVTNPKQREARVRTNQIDNTSATSLNQETRERLSESRQICVRSQVTRIKGKRDFLKNTNKTHGSTFIFPTKILAPPWYSSPHHASHPTWGNNFVQNQVFIGSFHGS